jgi:hypothetical protein
VVAAAVAADPSVAVGPSVAVEPDERACCGPGVARLANVSSRSGHSVPYRLLDALGTLDVSDRGPVVTAAIIAAIIAVIAATRPPPR